MEESSEGSYEDQIDAQLPPWVHTLRRRFKELEDSGKLEELLQGDSERPKNSIIPGKGITLVITMHIQLSDVTGERTRFADGLYPQVEADQEKAE